MRDEDTEIIREDLDDSVLAEENAQGRLDKLKSKLKEAEGKAKEYLDGWQRAQADFANLRRKDEEAKKDFLKFANQDLLEELLPVLDSFTIAIDSGEKSLEPIAKQLLSILKSKGLEEIHPEGQIFDPRSHEAVSTQEVSSAEEDHKILKVLQKGYTLQGKIIRPAKVTIGTYNG